jgi:hypothetical protein
MHRTLLPTLTGMTAVAFLALAGSPPVSAQLLFSDTSYLVPEDLDRYLEHMMSGGPPPDGIPAIDEPRFTSAGEARLAPGDIVIGFAHGGVARAYPQRILVHHEIVNDEVGGLPVAITYCPLTATAQGFKRGSTTLGVSGQLLNSNVVLFDRATRSYFSQILGTGLRGEHQGRTLDEVNLIWTTWERWRAAYPDTEVLSERTGHMRNYTRDPYGSYNPESGYYVQNRTMFPLMNSSSELPLKEMVVGGRNAKHAVHFVLTELARAGVQSTEHFLAVYDEALDTGYIYELDGEMPEVRPVGDGRYELDGEAYAPDALPLPSLIPIEAFFFAWHSFYPESETPS